MSQRILPAPDRFAICPSDGPILPFYDGVFEAAWVLLNPFMRPTVPPVERFLQETRDASPAALCAACEPVRWSHVREQAQLPSLAAIDVALRTGIGGLAPGFADKTLTKQLDGALARHGLVVPGEGVFPELQHEAVLSFIQSLGHEWLWVGDELCTERELRWIEDLKPANAGLDRLRGNLFTPDKSLLWTVHWDSHFSLICSSREVVARLSAHPGLEGFACGPATEIYWSLAHD